MKAFARSTYQSVYVIDYFREGFAYYFSIVESAKKHNNTPYEAIRALFEGTDKFCVVAFAE